jgi:hypothetical protein
MKSANLMKRLFLLIFVTLTLNLNAQIKPVVYYTFDETSGTTIHDMSGNDFHGTLSGPSEFVTGKYNGALYFSGDSAVVDMPAKDIALTTYKGTVVFWMICPLYDHISIMWWSGDGTDRMDSFGTGAMHIHYEKAQDGIWMGGELVFYASAPEGSNFLHSDPEKFGETATDPGNPPVNPTLIADSVWHHIAVVWGDGGNMLLYVDGVKISSWTYTSKPDLQLKYMRIGRALSGGRVYNGIIDEFRIYNSALKADKIAELYAYDPTSVSEINVDKFDLIIGPNPFNNITTISYQLQKSSDVLLNIYNLTGQKVRTLVQREQVTGLQSVNWDGSNDAGIQLSAGTYLCRLQVDGETQTKILTFIK